MFHKTGISLHKIFLTTFEPKQIEPEIAVA